jgi:hypothetical protein
MGIDDPTAVATLPQVSSILRYARGGLATVLTGLRASEEPDAHIFTAKYDSISRDDLRRVRWEEIAFAANLDPYRLLEVAVSALVKQGETIGQLISATAHPLIVKKSVTMALKDYGKADRRNLLLARGFLPISAGATIYNRVQIANQNNVSTGAEKGTLPEMEDDLHAIHGLLIGQ